MPPSPDLIRVSLFRNGKAEFLTLLAESKAAYRIRVPEPDVIVNAGEMVEVLKATLGNAPWAALAYVLVAWIKGRPTERSSLPNQTARLFIWKASRYPKNKSQKYLRAAAR